MPADPYAWLERGAHDLPPKLAAMVARYSAQARSGNAVAVLRSGARALNSAFACLEAGDEAFLEAMRADGINAMSMAATADLFDAAASAVEALEERGVIWSTPASVVEMKR